MKVFAAVGGALLTIAANSTGQTAPPIHVLDSIVAQSAPGIGLLAGDGKPMSFAGLVGNVRVLDDGRLIINDQQASRLVLLDRSLQTMTILADTTAATGRLYGKGLAGCYRYSGDSTVLLDRQTGAMLIFDGSGKLGRIAPAFIPQFTAANGISSLLSSPVGFDMQGRALFSDPSPSLSLLGANATGEGTQIDGPDSTAILRVNLHTKKLDTIAVIAPPRTHVTVVANARGGTLQRPSTNPVPFGDDWALLPDGSVAIVHVNDYHVDRVSPTGAVSRGAKVPTDWRPITDSAKRAIIDTARAGTRRRDSVGRAGAIARGGVFYETQFMQPSDLPDFYPPFVAGGTKADGDGNIWVQVNPMFVNGHTVFDVIDRDGIRIDRVALSLGGGIVGFGPGVVYAMRGPQLVAIKTR